MSISRRSPASCSFRTSLGRTGVALLLSGALAGCRREGPPAPPADAAPAAPPRTRTAVPVDAADGGLLARKLPRMEYRGGPFLRAPRLVTVTSTKDEPRLVARLEQLAGSLTRSSWWHDVTDGYCSAPGTCIGEGSAGAPVHLDEALPAQLREAEADAILVRLAKGGRLGPIDESTLVLFYLPKGVTLTDGKTAYCGAGARAFHRSLDLDGKHVPFAVLPRCADEAQLTGTASHEILEATTNPFPAERGFAFGAAAGLSAFGEAGLEPVDPCGLTMMDHHWTNEGGFVVHRAWSNREAALAHDPCVPARADHPYVMLVPRELALRLPKEGDTITVDLDASAADATGPWAVSAFDLSGFHDHAQYVDLTLDRSTVRAGDSVRLSVTSRKQNPRQREIVALVSTVGVHAHMWPLLVMMR